MKTLIILFICGCLFTVNNASAQQQPKDKMLPVVTITAIGTNVNAKVRDAFQKSFKDAENMRWYSINQNYLAKFIQDDQQHNALFSKNGRLIYHIAYGFEKNLPSAIRHQIKAKYYDYNITRVFQVNQDSRKIWVVNLADKDYLILARIENGEMNMVSRVKNGTPEYTSAALGKKR